jgi:Zn-dependent protease
MATVTLPKFPASEKKSNPWISSLLSLMAYILVATIFINDIKIALILVLILLIHEAGHYLAMRYFRYHETGIFFIPLLGAFVSGSKRIISQQESAIIILAGPLPGILLGLSLSMLNKTLGLESTVSATLDWSAMALILLNGLNLLPLYPLDGGQLLNRVFLDEESTLGRVFVFISALLIAALALLIQFYALLLFPLLLLWRSQKDRSLKKVEAKLKEAGINTDIDYEDLPDEDYWKIRTLLIENHPRFASVDPATDSYDEKEASIQIMIVSLLDRRLMMDLSLPKKLMIATLWMAALFLTVLFGFLSWRGN